MSGHNKWTQIKHQKGATDKRRGLVFSKILKAISVAARTEPNPDFNPRLRSLIDKAHENNVPSENIERAVKKTADVDDLEELVLEAYGPAGIAVLMRAITDNRNRTINELKRLIAENGGKFAEQGSVRWAFDGLSPKFPQAASPKDAEAVRRLVEALEEHGDVQETATNLQ